MIPSKKDLVPYIENRKEAAKIFGVTEKTIINWMKKYDVYKAKENYGCGKLNMEKAKEIRKLYNNDVTIKELSLMYKVTFATISRIINNLIYKESNDSAVVNVVYNVDQTNDISAVSFSGKNKNKSKK